MSYRLAGFDPNQVSSFLAASNGSEIRAAAAAALGRIRAKEQVPALVEVLNDRDPILRRAAVVALGQMEAREQATKLVDLLGDSEPTVRSAAAAALGQMQAREQAPALAKLLNDTDPAISNVAAAAIGRMQAKEQAPKLVELIKTLAPNASAAAAALGQMQAKEQAPALVELLRNEDPQVRLAAVDVLGQMQAKEQAPALFELLRNKDPQVRFAAVDVLGQMLAREQTPEVVKLLKDQDPTVRQQAAAALGQMHAREQATELVKLFNDQDPYVRRAAVFALGRMQAIDQASALVKLLKHQEPYTPGPDAGLILMKGKEHGRGSVLFSQYPDTSGAATTTIHGQTQANELVPAPVELPRYEDPNVNVNRLRAAVATALGWMDAKEQVGNLVELLADQNADVRSAAAAALGRMDAKEQASKLVKLLADTDPDVRCSAVESLGQMRAIDQAPELVKLLNHQNPNVRSAVARALGQMRAIDQAPELIKLLKDGDFRSTAATALMYMGPFPKKTISQLSSIFYSNPDGEQSTVRFLCYFLTGGDLSVTNVLKRVMFNLSADQQPAKITNANEAREVMRAFADLRPVMGATADLAQDADRQIIEVARTWKNRTRADNAELVGLSREMSADLGQVLRSMTIKPWWQIVLEKAWKIIVVQVLLWVLLIFFYPKSPWVQAFFFWNPWVRKSFGLMYVDLCLTFIPFLRNRLLSPFRDDLAAEARLNDRTLDGYFPGAEVEEYGKKGSLEIWRAIHGITGQMVLEGESGLGKTTFLRLLVKRSPVPMAYLSASSCEQGVFEAIQLRLKGNAADESFLKTILWSGGLNVIVDGLNEVTVETRERIQRFLVDFSKARVLLATQPLRWTSPPKARVFKMLPLAEDRILEFLLARYSTFESPKSSRDVYKVSCQAYLGEVLSFSQPDEDRLAAISVLSNPMDLTTAAVILASGERPTLSNLQAQQFKQMAADYKRHQAGEEVPLAQFSEAVYEARLRNDAALPSSDFIGLIREMAYHKMALEQIDTSASGQMTRKWIFRHEKIRDYFLMQAFLANEARIIENIGDTRFRGVYLILASQLPLDQARELKEALVEHAAETRDHQLSDTVVQILKARRSKNNESLTLSKTMT